MSYLANHSVNSTSLTNEQKELLAQACELHRIAETRKAESLYRKILALGPICAEAYSNLGAIILEDGKANQALSLLGKAHQRFPNHAGINANLAACHGTLNNWRACLRYSKQAADDDTANPMPWLWHARSLHAIVGPESAIDLLEKCTGDRRISDSKQLYAELILYLSASRHSSRVVKAIASGLTLYPDSTSILDSALATALSKRKTHSFLKISGRLIGNKSAPTQYLYYHAKLLLAQDKEAEAIHTLLKAVRLMPAHGPSWRELGAILRKQKNYHKAIACLRRSIREQPKDKQAWVELIDTLKDNENLAEALTEAHNARKIFPEDISILLNTAYAMNENRAGEQALELVSNFFIRRPWLNRPHESWNCEGLILISLKQYTTAVSAFRHGLRLSPRDAGLWNNMGMAYGMANKKHAEILSYRNAIRHAPEDHGSHMNLAMALLAQNDFANGLDEYEWRLRAKNPLHVYIEGELLTPTDHPQEIYVCTEQGLGDIIQFSRFLYDLNLHRPDSSIILVCPEKLVGLMKHSFPFVKGFICTENFEAPSARPTYAPIMSIPAILKIDPRHSAAPPSYIKAPFKTERKIRDRIRTCVSNESVLIGLTWKGNPQTEKTNLAGRSSNLEEFRLLAEMIPNAVFLSAQKGVGSEELGYCSFRDRFIDIQDEISDDWCFINTACYLLACDHVVTTDTCNAHLSGSLGVSTHLLLSSPCEWRWRSEHEQSAWYKTMRTYKQSCGGNWKDPIEAAGKAILRAVKSSPKH